MKYIKKFESRYTEDDIDKKYYVWKSSSQFTGIIEIVKSIKKKVYYKIIYRTGGYRDFFTNKHDSNTLINIHWTPVYKISLSYWKSRMINDLLYDTDNLNDALQFYRMYNKDNSITKNDFELHKDINKYNL